jgi:hypothetical protein
MTTYRLLPPVAVGSQQRTAYGRSYSGTPGEAFDVASSDAQILTCNGWIFLALSGPTSARPTPTLSGATGAEGVQANPGARFFDTTLNQMIFCDGATWRDAAGASV